MFYLTEWLLRNILFFNKDRSTVSVAWGLRSPKFSENCCRLSTGVWVANSAELVTVEAIVLSG